MGRRREYATDQERMKAWRQRLAERQAAENRATPPPPLPREKKVKTLSRQARVTALEAEAINLHEELQSWRDSMHENLQSSSTAERLESAMEVLSEVVSLLGGLEIPKGFGRD